MASPASVRKAVPANRSSPRPPLACRDRQSVCEFHTALAKKVPGLTRWVQNQVVGAPGEPICDGIGELWFESDAVMETALKSAEFGAAVVDAKNFLDMERTGMVIVQGNTAIG